MMAATIPWSQIEWPINDRTRTLECSLEENHEKRVCMFLCDWLDGLVKAVVICAVSITTKTS